MYEMTYNDVVAMLCQCICVFQRDLIENCIYLVKVRLCQ